MANPYDRQLHLKTFLIEYIGRAETFYCFKIHLRNHNGLDAWAFRSKVCEWALENAFGKNFVGNGFGTSKDHPEFNYENPDKKDTFVLFEKLIDVAMFEDAFEVTGFSPTMVV